MSPFLLYIARAGLYLSLFYAFYLLVMRRTTFFRLNRVLQRDSIPAVVSHIGDSLNSMKQADSALWYYRRSLALRPMNETTLSKAMGILLGAEDFDGALSLSEPFLELDPDNTTIAPLQGLALYRKEDYKQALEWYEKYMKVARPGSNGYKFVEESIAYLKAELFMEAP